MATHPPSQDWSHQTQVNTRLPNVTAHSSCRIFKGQEVVADSGNVIDKTLKGGRLGVLCFSQEQLIWSDLSYNCRERLPQEVYNELSQEEQNEVSSLCSRLVILSRSRLTNSCPGGLWETRRDGRTTRKPLGQGLQGGEPQGLGLRL